MRRLLLTIAFSLVLAACSSAGADPGTGCDVTVPDRAFLPPAPYPAAPPAAYGTAWYGTADLWTALPDDGPVWNALPTDGGVLSQKTFWWRDGYTIADETPDITVTAVRRDGDSPTVTFHPGTNGSHPDLGAFMLVGIELPAAGCWEITASFAGAELPYVVLADG